MQNVSQFVLRLYSRATTPKPRRRLCGLGKTPSEPYPMPEPKNGPAFTGKIKSVRWVCRILLHLQGKMSPRNAKEVQETCLISILVWLNKIANSKQILCMQSFNFVPPYSLTNSHNTRQRRAFEQAAHQHSHVDAWPCVDQRPPDQQSILVPTHGWMN